MAQNNGARGEGVIQVGEREVARVLFTNRALLNAERQLNKGILGVLDGFMGGSSGFTELVALLQAGMEAARRDERRAGRPVSNKEALAVLDEVGFTAAIAPVLEAVAAVLNYSSDEDEEPDEDETDPN